MVGITFYSNPRTWADASTGSRLPKSLASWRSSLSMITSAESCHPPPCPLPGEQTPFPPPLSSWRTSQPSGCEQSPPVLRHLYHHARLERDHNGDVDRCVLAVGPDWYEDVRWALVRAGEQVVHILLGAELRLLGQLEQTVPQVAVPGDPLPTNCTADGVVTVHVSHPIAV